MTEGGSGLRRARGALMSGGGGFKALRWAAILAIIGVLLFLFPPFHIRRIDDHHRRPGDDHSASADIAHRATRFWDGSLTSQQVHPTDWLVLVKALREDPLQANRRYGRRSAIGGPWYYLLSGEARVVSIDSRGLWLGAPALEPWRVLLQTGPIFGSALRDATGLLKLADFSSFDFNELGAQLNRLSEDRIGAGLRRDARVGGQLEFVAAARLDDLSADGHTLLLAPIKVSLK